VRRLDDVINQIFNMIIITLIHNNTRNLSMDVKYFNCYNSLGFVMLS
jgi:hypothetical protein